MSFEEAYNEFIVYARNRHKKQGFYTITQDFNRHILPYFTDKKISEITKNDILRWQDRILEKTLVIILMTNYILFLIRFLSIVYFVLLLLKMLLLKLVHLNGKLNIKNIQLIL